MNDEPLRVSWQFPVTAPLPKLRNSAYFIELDGYSKVRVVVLDDLSSVMDALEALDRGEQSLDIASAPACAHALAVCRAKAALTLARLADTDEAIAKYGRARECFAALDCVEGVAVCSFALGILLRRRCRYELATEEFTTAHRLFDLLGRYDRVADCLLEVSPCLAVLGRHVTSLPAPPRTCPGLPGLVPPCRRPARYAARGPNSRSPPGTQDTRIAP